MKRLLLVLAVVCGACGENYSSGTRVGIVTKLSEKGMFCRSWEGEMLMALPAAIAGTTQPEKFTFNVAPVVVAKVQDAMQTGARVELVYRQWAVSPLCIDSDYTITDVRPTK